MLDITALNEIKKLDNPHSPTAAFKVKLRNGPCVPKTCEPGTYTYGSLDHVLSIPYSTYSEHRALLFRFFYGLSYDLYLEGEREFDESKPFYYIFYHGNTEGDFTGEALIKTANDFRNHMVSIANKNTNDDFIAWYSAMFRGFSQAVKSNGAIQFR